MQRSVGLPIDSTQVDISTGWRKQPRMCTHAKCVQADVSTNSAYAMDQSNIHLHLPVSSDQGHASANNALAF